jgi:hypothetical protein
VTAGRAGEAPQTAPPPHTSCPAAHAWVHASPTRQRMSITGHLRVIATRRILPVS